jgi:hypothetical protein
MRSLVAGEELGYASLPCLMPLFGVSLTTWYAHVEGSLTGFWEDAALQLSLKEQKSFCCVTEVDGEATIEKGLKVQMLL